MREFLAKSNPRETIQEHTDNLIKNYEILKSIYPNLEIDWDILYLACLYHDFGKINDKFQQRLRTGKKNKGEIPHNLLSLAFINFNELEDIGYDENDIKILFHSIVYHHERDLDFSDEEIEDEIELLKESFEQMEYSKIKAKFINDIIEDQFYIINDRFYEKNGSREFLQYIMIKGLLNRIDYAASAHIEIENKNDFLSRSLQNLLKNWQQRDNDADWNELQQYMIKNQNESNIVIAQTGMGKTEAGLLWIGDNKGFFTLPLKTAINSIYKRITTEIIPDDFKNKVGLLHSDTLSEYLNIETEDIDFDEYYNKTKQLSLPLTICTLDQIFDFVYRYRGFESKLATLSYSKVVIDEIQMYSPDLLSYLIIGIRYMTEVGGKFSILTATLPRIIIDLLQEENIDFIMPDKPFIDSTYNRHSLKTIEESINVDYILNHYNKNKVLVICNTVKKAQEIYKDLKDKKVENINLLHSGFIKKDRRFKEEQIINMGKKESDEYGIWVSTQIVEASLDIDFDILITELSDINGLFQRMGRCYRKRELLDKKHNCHVFIGGEKDMCSGIGHVIDKDIFELSRKSIKDIDGVLTEQEKIDLVDCVYTTENLKDTEYYKLLKNNINYVRGIDDHEKSKLEVQKIFRNIDSRIVIPLDIYSKNYDMIHSYLDIISKKYDKRVKDEERKKRRYEKITARNALMDLTLSVRPYALEGNILENLKLNNYEYIPVLNCKYSEEIGIEVIKSERTNKDKSANNNII
jgi:CRISPR-associated endonuclease/helicase Cas3